MAKDKKGKSAKRIAGAKVPKELRKAGNAARKLARQPVVSELVAAALTAAAASLAQGRTGRAVRRETGEAAAEVAKTGAAAGEAVKRALLDAARTLLDTIDDAASGATKGKGEDSGSGKKRKLKAPGKEGKS